MAAVQDAALPDWHLLLNDVSLPVRPCFFLTCASCLDTCPLKSHIKGPAPSFVERQWKL